MVQHDDIGNISARRVESVIAVTGREHAVAALLEVRRMNSKELELVVHEEYGRHGPALLPEIWC
jgi:hypothetical protein